MTTQGIERIPDSLGYLVLTEDGAVVSSGGDLENDESLANKLCKIVHTASSIPVTDDRRDTFKRLSVSNQKIYVCKKKYIPQDPVLT